MTEPPARLPRLSPARVADAVVHLADSVDDADLRAQLHALAGIVANLVAAPVDAQLVDAYDELADATDDELAGLLARVAELESRHVAPVDWDAVSHG